MSAFTPAVPITVSPLDRSAAVENKFPPQVVSSTSAGLAPCRPGFDFQCTVADDASNGAGVGSENSITGTTDISPTQNGKSMKPASRGLEILQARAPIPK